MIQKSKQTAVLTIPIIQDCFIKFSAIFMMLILMNFGVKGQLLGSYPNTSVISGQNTTITPSVAPINVTSMVAYTNTNFTGILTVNPTTGVVTVTDAKQAGIYPITVKAFNGVLTANSNFTLTVTNPYCSSGLFTGTSGLAVGVQPYCIAIGDFNGDGLQDIVSSNAGSNTVSIRLGNGVGGLVGTTNIGVGATPYGVAVGDFNGDGKQDIVTANASSNTVSILLGNGLGGVSGSTTLSVGSTPFGVVVADFNGDGKQDIAVSCSNSNVVAIRLGNGDGSFNGSTNVGIGGSWPYGLTLGDFNSDGNQDIACTNRNGNIISIRLGNGLGGFSGNTEVAVGSQPVGIAVGDFNGDGNQDIVTANYNYSSSSTVSIRMGDGAGGFSGSTNIPVGNGAFTVAVGDFNGDGNQDIVVSNSTDGKVSILLGNGTGAISGNLLINGENGVYGVAVGDFNGDGKEDIADSKHISNTVSILLGGDSEINVQSNSTTIPDGNTVPSTTNNTEFGYEIVGNNNLHTYTIQNTGNSPLAISSITLSGGDAGMFAIGALSPASSIAAGGSATFTVTFAPTSTGSKTTTLHIANDDCNEVDYDFVIQGNGCVAPAITSPGNITVNTNFSGCTYNGSIGSATATGNCGAVVVTGPVPAGPYPLGTTVVTWTATDEMGNSVTSVQNVTVTNPTAITANVTSDYNGAQISCANSTNGIITANGSGGFGTYTYTIDNGLNYQSGNTFSNLAAGVYTIVVRDGITCTSSTNVTIAAPSLVTFQNNSVVNPLCPGTDGTLNFSATGGKGKVAYIGNGTNNTVTVVNIITNSTIATIPVGNNPFGFSVSPNGNFVYLTNTYSNSVSVINTSSNTVVATIPVGNTPYGLRVTPDGSKVFVANTGSNNVSVISTSTNAVIATIPVGNYPTGVAMSPDGEKTYIGNRLGGSVSIINNATNTVSATVSGLDGAWGIAVSPDNLKYYVVCYDAQSLKVVDALTNTIISTIYGFSDPFDVVLNEDGSRAYVTNLYSNNIAVINTQTNSIITYIGNGDEPLGLAFDKSTNKLYSTNPSGNNVYVINTLTNSIENTLYGITTPASWGNFLGNVPGSPGTFSYTVNGSAANSPYIAPIGSYTIIATDANGCTASVSQTISATDNQAPTITKCAVTRTVTGCSVGDITNPPYSTVSTNSSEALFEDATNGGNASDACGINTVSYIDVVSGTCPILVTRTWTIADAKGNSTSCDQIINIISPAVSITQAVNKTYASCEFANQTAAQNAFNNWLATAGVSGGCDATSIPNVTIAPAYCGGSVLVTWTIAANCFTSTYNAIFTITAAEPITASAFISKVNCKGNNSGAINLTVSGGCNLSYLWNNGATTEDIVNLYAGIYKATISDGCQTKVVNFTVTEPIAGLLLTGTVKKPKCSTGNTGSATVAISGGVGTYSNQWSNGQINATATGLGGGIYTVTITDASNCTRSMTFIIVAPAPLIITSATVNPTNALPTNGAITVVASGGTPNYVYLWNTVPFKTTFAITGLPAGTYTVKVTDKNTCSATQSIQLVLTGKLLSSAPQPTQLTVKVMPNPNDGLFNFCVTAAKNGNATIELMDLSGRIVMSEIMPLIIGTNTMELNAQALPKGIYLLRFNLMNEVKTIRLVIE